MLIVEPTSHAWYIALDVTKIISTCPILSNLTSSPAAQFSSTSSRRRLPQRLLPPQLYSVRRRSPSLGKFFLGYMKTSVSFGPAVV